MPELTSEIQISAPVEVVYELAQNIEAFPEYMPDIKEVTILERNGSELVSRWGSYVKEFARTVKWIEKDHWDDEKRICTFSQVEGDFTEYEGEWYFEADGEGSKMRLIVRYELNLPLIGALIQGLLKKKVQENSDNMLAALKEKAESVA